MSQHTFQEKTNKTKGQIGNENEVEVSAGFVMYLDYAYTPTFHISSLTLLCIALLSYYSNVPH